MYNNVDSSRKWFIDRWQWCNVMGKKCIPNSLYSKKSYLKRGDNCLKSMLQWNIIFRQSPMCTIKGYYDCVG